MITTIPTVLKGSPRFLFWKQEDSSMMRSVKVLVGVEDPVNITAVEGSSDAFSHELEVVEDGKEFLLNITPAQAGKLRGYLMIVTDYPAEDPKTYKLHLHVR